MSFQPAIWPPQWPEIGSAIAATVASGDWGQYSSQAHSQLTPAIADLFQVEHVRLCPSGTAAIEMALRAANISTGDEVITAAFDYPGNLRCIEAVGATPSLADVASNGMCLTEPGVLAASSPATRAVIASHLYGHAADVGSIRRLCNDRGWLLVEDACQVPGMRLHEDSTWRPAGSFGHIAALSFGGSKPLTAGNGGALLTSDRRLIARLNSLYDRPSDTFPLAALQAAAILPQLPRLTDINSIRAATVTALHQQTHHHFPEWTIFAELAPSVVPCYYKLAILVASSKQRARLVTLAQQLGIPLGEGFRSLHRLSDRRCRKRTPLTRSAMLGDRLCVLDHRALMIDPGCHHQMIAALGELYDRTEDAI